MRSGGVRQKPVPQSADALRQTAAAAAVAEDGERPGDRAAVFRSAGWQDADRDVDS